MPWGGFLGTSYFCKPLEMPIFCPAEIAPYAYQLHGILTDWRFFTMVKGTGHRFAQRTAP